MLHPSQPTHDPNFPSFLDIRPLHLENTAAAAGADAHAQATAIGKYGIAGRVWEATARLVAYLTPTPPPSVPVSSPSESEAPKAETETEAKTKAKYDPFDPPCSLFSPSPSSSHRILELGSGQALASLHLAARLPARDTVVLTDLPNVIPLCQASIDTWARDGEGRAVEGAEGPAKVVALPLAWGESAAHLAPYGPFTHILMCDLVSLSERSEESRAHAHLGLLPAPVSPAPPHFTRSDGAGGGAGYRGVRPGDHPSV